MAEQRQSSRFRLPSWLQRPRPSSKRPTARRRGAGQTQPPPSPPPESQLSPPGPPPTERTQSRRSQPTSKPVSLPSRASAKPQDASQDTSPFPVEVEFPIATQPPSPSRAPTQTKAETQQPSQADQQTQSPPPSLASQPSVQTSSMPPPSQSLTATQAQSAPGGVAQPPLPSENLQPMTHPLPSGVTEILDAALGSEVATQIHPSVASDAEQKQLEKEKISGKKETTSESSSHRKEDQTVMVISKNKATDSESCHESNISKVEKAPQQKKIREDISKFLHGMATDQQKLPLGEGPAAVVTLAGENRGASMHLGLESAKRDGTVHIHRGYKINPDESSTDGEMISEETGSQDSQTGEDQEPKAYINSNVQSVNNSIICNSSVNERDPGVQLAFTQDLTEPYEPKRTRSMKSPETHEAEVIVTTAKKLTYKPTVRRRCLRGLFLEPSDSDSDNPEKPRRRGCRYACKGRSKDNETDVL